MKVLKWVGIGVVALILVIVIVGLFSPAKVHVERSRVINADQSTLYAMLQTPKTFVGWSPWSEVDSTMTLDYFGPSAGPGAGYNWNSDDWMVGQGTWTVRSATPMNEIIVDIDFDGSGGFSTYKLEEAEGGTQVTWMMDSELGSDPFSKFFGLMMPGMIGDMYDRGLERLDSTIQAMPKGRIEDIRVEEAQGFAMLSVRKETSTDNLGAMLAESYGSIVSYITANKLDMTAPPFAIYHSWPEEDGGMADVEAAIPIGTPNAGDDIVKGSLFPTGMVVRANYYGPYEASDQGHMAIHAWAEQNGHMLDDSPWEIYVTDPESEPDPAKWLTIITYRIKSSET